jgi:CRISPR system Cascade subunit CasD
MTTLLLRLQAPMQSWGISSLFTERDSAREPSKSGVIGLICAALGRPRDAALSDLSTLRMGVRIDREGSLEKDFQTARNVYAASGNKTVESVISNRYYLADAAFLVGLEGPRDLLIHIQTAMQHPKWTLYLGRKAFPPALPVALTDGLQERYLLEALRDFPSLVEDSSPPYRIAIEDADGEFIRQDVPINFAKREFGTRRISIAYLGQPAQEGG